MAATGLLRGTTDFAKSVRSLVRIKKNIFMNSIRDVGYVGRVAVVVLIIVFSLYSALSGSGLIVALKYMVRGDPSFLHPLVSVAMFFIFIANLLAVVLIGGSRILLFDKLIYYPIDPWKGATFEILAGTVEPLNLIFLPLYIAVCILPQNPFTVVTVLATLFLMLLFVLLVSNISLLIRITVAMTASFKHLRRIMTAVMFGLIFLAFASIEFFGRYVVTKEHVLTMSSILSYSPSGVWVNGIFGLGTAHPIRSLVPAVVYLLWMNFVVLWVTTRITPALKRRIFSLASSENGGGKRSILGWVARLKTSPLAKKNIIYTLRSSRKLMQLAMFFGFTLLFPAFYFIKSNRTVFSPYHEGFILVMTFVFQWEGLMVLCGSVFSNDYFGIVNYFFRPVSPEAVLSSKRVVPEYLAVSGAFIILAAGLFLKDGLLSSFIVSSVVLLAEFSLVETGMLLSVYFVKPDPFRMSLWMGHVDSSARSLLISIPIAGTFAAAMYFVMTLSLSAVEELAVLCAILLLFPLFFSLRRRADKIIGRILINRKEKVITRCRTMP